MANETIRIDLPELGDDQYVLMRSPKTLSWGMQKRILELGDARDAASNLRRAEIVTLSLVTGGNLADVDGNAVTFPLTDASLDTIPGEVLVAVVNKFGEVRGVDVPKNS